ncbi:MAG: tetratricopeptide repeat protein [Bacteroidia bacterium]
MLLTLFCSFSVYISGQNQDAALAVQYYDKGEYEKAEVLLKDLYKNNEEIWFQYYYNTLLELKEYDRAEKVTKKQIKSHKNDFSFYVLLGKVYALTNNKKKENETYEKAIDKIPPAHVYINNLAQAFMTEKLYDLALSVYDKGAKANPDYPYFYEKAEVYKAKNDLSAMINAYLDAIEFRSPELYTAQSHLQNSLGYSDEGSGLYNPILKQELQKRIQKSPDNTIFSEFLIFILKQQKDFNGAFIQSRALDKRNNEDGSRIYDLAKLCVSNKEWETALRCYEYLVDKSNSFYSETAGIEILDVEFQMISENPNVQKEKLIALETKYNKAYDKYSATSIQLIIIPNFARLLAFYLDKTEYAITILDEAIKNPGTKPLDNAAMKMLQGDIYMLIGQIWDASLLYSQVEKDFKHESIGHEAKFKNAKLSFYAGDFKWAKAQCDVLKGATSKLIANDALDLSLVITDAIGVDTNDAPLKKFAAADLLIMQHKFEEAMVELDSINTLFHNHTLGDDIYYKKAQLYIKKAKYELAAEMYKKIIEFYPTELYGDDAQYKLAELYETKLNNKETAKKEYENLITNYPGSIYVVDARKKYRILRGEQINN